jgi:hypothetical protein
MILHICKHCRSKSGEIKDWKENGVEVIVGDLNSEDDVKTAYESMPLPTSQLHLNWSLSGYDTIISALGRNAILAQIPLLKLAEASPSIHTFYLSEFRTDIEYGPMSVIEAPINPSSKWAGISVGMSRSSRSPISSMGVLKQLEQETWAKDSPLKTVLTLRVIWYEGGTLYDERSSGSIGFEGQEEGLKE